MIFYPARLCVSNRRRSTSRSQSSCLISSGFSLGGGALRLTPSVFPAAFVSFAAFPLGAGGAMEPARREGFSFGGRDGGRDGGEM